MDEEVASKEEEGEETGSQDHWYLVDTHGQKFRLPKTMLFLGREECDVVVASPSVDKRHAVLTFDLYLNRFKVKDLSTTNGTFVNNSRIPEQEYITLQHMDSVRLGYDAMMYHIEQGSQITSQGGNLPDPRIIPSWATRRSQEPPTIHVHAHAMAECQGCIAEQNIEHSCGLYSERCEEDKRTINDPDSRLHKQQTHHHHHQQQQQEPHRQSPQQAHQNSSPATTPTNAPATDVEYQRPQGHQDELQKDQEESNGSRDIITHGDNEDPNNVGRSSTTVRNTWPRKRARQMPHVGSIFGAPESADAADANNSSTSEARPAGPMSAMYFVSFDDSVCNGSTTDLNGDSSQRIPRNSKNPLPAELSTVKKGTPLYGQPAWWGESEEGDVDSSQATSASPKPAVVKRGANLKDSRPSSLVLSNKDPSAMENENAKPDPVSRHLSSGSTYMEIPVHDEDVSPENADSPASGIPTSLSKDSLFSPDAKPDQIAKGSKEWSPSVEKNPAMSFTIDLDDRPKKVNMGVSLSNFVPSKMRRNMQERKDKTTAKSGSKESTPSKNSEERELSPTSQRKIDELWSAFEIKGKTTHLSSVHATAGSSLRSPNLEDIDRLSELSEERRSLERDGEKKGRKPVPSKSPQVSRTARAKPGTKSTGSVNQSQYSDPTSYLIDKMFEGRSAAASSSSEKEMSPEQKLYREAAGHDKPSRAKDKGPSSTTKHSQTQKATATAAGKDGKGVNGKGAGSAHKDSADDLKIVENASVDDREDKASEAGTYTIEVDEEEQDEVEAARKRIDEVFGVLSESSEASERPLMDLRLASPGGYDNVTEDNGDGDGDRTPQEVDGFIDTDDLVLCDGEEEEEERGQEDEGEEDDEEESDKMASAWVSQLTALTSQKAASVSADSPRATLEEEAMSLSKKPPHGLSRKRPGTGRKLPSIPTDRSPVSSEHSSFIGEQDISNLEDVASARTNDPPSIGKHSTAFSTVAPHQVSFKTATLNGHAASPTSRNMTQKGDAGSEASPKSSARSRGSVDTELLLQDTQTVMAAMEARMAYKSSTDHRNSHSLEDSDTDASSTAALVNGDEDYVKPTLFKSPRDAMSKRQREKISKPTASPSLSTQSTSTKKTSARSLSHAGTSKPQGVSSPRALYSVGGTKKSVVSDVFSRADSFENDSIISDVGSDAGDKTDPKGKGTITMTKPNRAFQLRRARADSTDEPSTPRSGKSVASSKGSVPGASVRSSSTHSTSRSRSGLDTGRTEASLGAQIVRKSRINERAEKAKSISNLDRADGGRFSLRLQRASSLTIAPQAAMTYPGKKDTTPKPHLKSTPSANSRGNLSITGVNGVSRSQSQPGSRSNSPKAAERMAWKRRKEYDPRRAVAEAKAKARDPTGSSSSSVTRHKPSTKDNLKRKMIRSASFGNSSQLSVHNSASSSHSLGLSSQRDHHEGESFRRAFIPFQNSIRSDNRSVHSADEDESLASGTSTQDTNKAYSLQVSSQPKSAFTPPLISKTSSSPDSPPPPLALLSLRRRSLQGVAGSQSLSLAPPSLSTRQANHCKPNGAILTPQISYDSLIVSSIYQLSLKLKTSTDKTLNKLREQDRVSFTPSPIDDFLADSGKSEITAWKSANQELAGILKNLRKIERHVQIINRVVFPEDDMNSDVNAGLSGREKQKYFQEIERIRSELAGFHPIENPRRDDEVTSPEMEEFDETF